MSNAFNRVSIQAVLDECGLFIPELMPWVSWCYDSHSILWHPKGTISSQSGVQQGDPLGPMLSALVLRKFVSCIEADDGCFDLSLNLWYLDDGMLAGERSAVVCALHLIEELGPTPIPSFLIWRSWGHQLGTSYTVLDSLLKNAAILGILLRALTDVSAVDLHIAISLLRMCGGYCKFAHLARTTPTSHCSDSLKLFDEEVRLCFASCLAVDVPDTKWHQAQLCPKLGGLGLNSLPLSSLIICAAFVFSLVASDLGSPDNIHLQHAFPTLMPRFLHRILLL